MSQQPFNATASTAGVAGVTASANTTDRAAPVGARRDSSGGFAASGAMALNAQPLLGGLPQEAWVKIGWIAALFFALFWPNLFRLWDKTNPFTGDANWRHAMLIPVIGIYYLYVNRESVLNPAPQRQVSDKAAGFRVWLLMMLALLFPVLLAHEIAGRFFRPIAGGVAVFLFISLIYLLSDPAAELAQRARAASAGWFGQAILINGVAIYLYGIYPGQNDYVKDVGMVVTLFGTVLSICGWGVMRIAWFPIAFLICGIPWPGLVYSMIASPLQQLAAKVAWHVLSIFGVEASGSGTRIFMVGKGGVVRTLNVAEACAGLRSLMTFITIGAIVGFLSHRPLWQKIFITVAAIPIAIACNVMRVCGQGLLDHYVSQQLSESFAHQFVGMIMLIPAVPMILLVGWLLDHIFEEQTDRAWANSATVIRRGGSTAPAIPGTVPATGGPSPLTAKFAAADATAAAAKAANAPVIPTAPNPKTIAAAVSPPAPNVASAVPPKPMPVARQPAPPVAPVAKTPLPPASRPLPPSKTTPAAVPPPPPTVRLAGRGEPLKPLGGTAPPRAQAAPPAPGSRAAAAATPPPQAPRPPAAPVKPPVTPTTAKPPAGPPPANPPANKTVTPAANPPAAAPAAKPPAPRPAPANPANPPAAAKPATPPASKPIGPIMPKPAANRPIRRPPEAKP